MQHATKEVMSGRLWATALALLTAGCSKTTPVLDPTMTTAALEVAPGIVSTGHQFMASVSPDGRTLLTVERRFPTPGAPPTLVIFESKRGPDGAWQSPDTASFSGRWRDIDPAFSPDGRRVWFNSARPAPGRDASRSDFDIWYVDRTPTGWGEPQRLPEPVNNPGSQYFATAATNGTIYYTVSHSTPVQKSWIVRSRPVANGEWTQPETLTVINHPPEDAGNPFIAPDESWLVFVAERPGGHGDSDIYISERRGASWSTPRNLGPRVNTAIAEFAPSVSADGRTLYFTRMSRGPDRNAVEERLYAIPFASVR